MSDVNVNTSWSSLPSSDTEYNTVLGAAGYDPDGAQLFLSAQQTPNPARTVTTEYARGFRITSGYDGIVIHDAIAESSKALKTVVFTMSLAGSAYDVTDARCYVQFKNHYAVAVTNWTLTANGGVTIANGSNIPSGGLLQVDFKNDYDTKRFILTLEFLGDPTGNYVVNGHLWRDIIGTTFNDGNYITQCNPVGSAPAGWYARVTTVPGGMAIVTNIPYGTSGFYGLTIRRNAGSGVSFGGSNFGGYVCGQVTNWGMPTSFEQQYDGYTEAINDYLNGTVEPEQGSAIDTSDFDNYTGPVWQCRLIVNVAAISPGPMATESEGGTEGDFDITSDQITAPALPSEGYAGTASMYLVDKLNLNRLKLSIFSANFWQQWITNFNDAVNSIVGILQIPVDASAIATGSLEHVRAANKELEWALGTVSGYVEGKPIQSRYISVDCGTVDLHLFWDSALDLNPYTKLNIYIPCVGMRALDADVVMGHTLGLYYNVDLMQGCALAVLTLDGDYLEQYPCSISTMFAIYGEQFTGLYQSVASTLATAAIGVTTAGSGGAMAGAIAGAATSAMAQKIHKGSAGTSASSMALLYQKQPYVEILRPIQQLPRDYTKFNAYPSYMTSQLINLSGYVEVQDIRLDDIDCTDAERSELMSMLQSGVIL